MPEYLDDPSVLTKDKLKSELLANNVELPSGNPTKDVYIRLYLENLTAKNNKHATAITLDAFSSDDELPLSVASRSRSSGRKATRKTDKVQPDELELTVLADQGLKDKLLKHRVDTGPILEVVAEPVTEPQPEPVPVVERPLRIQGKTALTPHTRSSQHHVVEKIAASDQTLKVEEGDVLKELFTSGINGPTGITVTCRRPIKGAANCSVKSSDLWNHENFLFSPKTIKTTSSFSSYTDSRSVNRMTSFPSSTSLNSSIHISSSSRPLSASQTCRISLWIKLFLLATVAGFLFLVYQAMETNSINPFAGPDMGLVSGSTA